MAHSFKYSNPFFSFQSDSIDISDSSDNNTNIQYTDDRIIMTAGGVPMLDLYETSQDVIKLGNGTDIDINFNDKAFLSGNNGKLGIATTTPNFNLDIDLQSSGGIRVKSTSDSYLLLDKGVSTENSFMALRTAGIDKWIIGSWNSQDDFMIKNWNGGGSGDNTFVIDATSSAIGLNTSSPSYSAMLGLYPDDDFSKGIYHISNRTTSGSTYGGHFIINNSYGGSSTSYGIYADVENDGASNGSVYGLYAYVNDDQTGTSSRYLRGVYGSVTVASTNGTSYAYGVYGVASGNADYKYGVYYSGGLAGSGTDTVRAVGPMDVLLSQPGGVDAYPALCTPFSPLG